VDKDHRGEEEEGERKVKDGKEERSERYRIKEGRGKKKNPKERTWL
jgi:hypothetical protein